MAKESGNKHRLVAAIDFGTTFSGYAFSFKSTSSKRDLHEQIRTNKSWGAELGFQSYKTPTSVLTNRAGSFLAFGFDAEQEYYQALEDDDSKPDMLMFRQFKMMLHKRECVKSSATIASLDGTTMPAIDIFSYAIRYLKDHLLNALKLETGSKPKSKEIRWVITVPAIWFDESKQFMRNAAFKAGCIKRMNSKNLIIALEPEAASLCCRRMNIAQYEGNETYTFPSGTKYLVLDCGGGTVDITMHVIQFDGRVKEILRASGGPWGGTEVDKNFIRLLQTVLGEDFINTLQKKNPQEWLQFLTSFERTKKSFKLDGKSKIVITIPFTMAMLFSQMNKGHSIDKELRESSGKGVTYGNGMIVIHQDAGKKLFVPVIDSVVDHTRTLLEDQKASGIKYIFMVGGFSECQILQSAVKDNFEQKGLKVLIPSEAQLAIIKGAVLFGHNPLEIGTRIARYSYGKHCFVKFDPDIHDEEHAKSFDGVKMCGDLFGCIVEQGEEVEVGSTRTLTSQPATADQEGSTISLYSYDGVPKSPVQYTTVRKMNQIGTMELDMPGHGLDRKIKVNFQFGGTEMRVDALDVTSGETTRTTVDFLSN